MTTPNPLLTKQDALLEKLVGTASIPVHDHFWHEVLDFGKPLTALRPAELDEFLLPYAAKLVVNNGESRNFTKLLIHLVENVKAVNSDIASLPVRAINTVVLIRSLIKYFVEHATPKQIISLVEDPEQEESDRTERNRHREFSLSSTRGFVVLPAAIQTVLQFLIDVDCSAFTFLLHLECCNLLLMMCSTQLTAAPGMSGPQSHVFLELLMHELDLAPKMVKRLLTHYIERAAPPPRMPLYQPPTAESSIMSRAGNAAASLVMMPFSLPYKMLVKAPPSAGSAAPLADISILLLLVLVHHDPSASGIPDITNPYQGAVNNCRDTEYDVSGDKDAAQDIIRVSFGSLFDTIGLCLVDDRSTLLLYSFIHGNTAFLEYTLVRSDLDTLLMPLLEMLYNAPRRTPNQIYMLLIILLILSQDASFNANIHKLILTKVPWYKERILPQISLGSLLVVVLIRTVKYNLSKLRDVYLHTNCLAALANMAPHVQNLNAYASQRLVSLFDMLAKKYIRLKESASATTADSQDSVETTDDASTARGEQGGVSTRDRSASDGTNGGTEEVTEVNIYMDFLRIVLEIINAILTYALPRNPEVIYALLHRQELFTPFKDHTRFSELLENIMAVLNYFNSRMQDLDTQKWSVEKVLEVVTVNARSWRGDGIKLFTELRFTYEEEANPEEFFVPYVWTLVCHHSGFTWEPEAIELFYPHDEAGNPDQTWVFSGSPTKDRMGEL